VVVAAVMLLICLDLCIAISTLSVSDLNDVENPDTFIRTTAKAFDIISLVIVNVLMAEILVCLGEGFEDLFWFARSL